ncbi:hypothetical protein [Sinimarinibacterium sp. CAU 1509]|uniref:hypothetical protein n=1 Tax=Sinimarinibacterium sp. CAU 1509 TaxID=2562283 RepID=UPI001B7FBC09|nr:hypothetical protein [Sinimarinibacterium sp. CAU 1509]
MTHSSSIDDDVAILRAARTSLDALETRLSVHVARASASHDRVGRSDVTVRIVALLGTVGYVAALILNKELLPPFGLAMGGMMAWVAILAVFADDIVWKLPWLGSKPRRLREAARRDLAAAIREAEATKEGGWLVRFSCFAAELPQSRFIRTFSADKEFDPEQYISAIAALQIALRQALEDVPFRNAAERSLAQWSSEVHTAVPPPVSAGLSP